MNTSQVVVGIGTDVGKTVVSALLVKLTGFTYLKPVQAGIFRAQILNELGNC